MKHNIKVCMGSSCFARGNLENLNFLENYIKENNLQNSVKLLGYQENPYKFMKNADIFAIREALNPYFDQILLDLRGR